MGFQFTKVRDRKVAAPPFIIDDQEPLNMVINANVLTKAKLEDVHNRIAASIRKQREADGDVETGFNDALAQADGLADMLSRAIDTWDAEDGEPTFEFLGTLPVGLLSDLLMHCMEAVGPKKKTARK